MRILKRTFEQNQPKHLYITTFYVTGIISVYYEIVR